MADRKQLTGRQAQRAIRVLSGGHARPTPSVERPFKKAVSNVTGNRRRSW